MLRDPVLKLNTKPIQRGLPVPNVFKGVLAPQFGLEPGTYELTEN